MKNKTWLNEKSHEAYAKHYSIAYHYDQPLAARNLRKDALHEVNSFDIYVKSLLFVEVIYDKIKKIISAVC